MSAVSIDAVQDKEKFVAFCCSMTPFQSPLPVSRLSFTGVFGAMSGHPSAVLFLNRLGLQRNEMHSALGSEKMQLDHKLSALDAYLPSCFMLFRHLKQNAHLASRARLSFEWRTSIFSHADETFKSSDILFELLAVLISKAVLHYGIASELLKTSQSGGLSEAGKHMLSAASVMYFIHEKIQSGLWDPHTFNPKKRPPVIANPKLCLGLAHLFSGSAQSMAVVKALGNDATSPTFKAGLCISVAKSMIRSMEAFACVPPPTQSEQATTAFNAILSHVATKREFYSALTYMYLAQSCGDKAESGLAIAYCNAAKAHLTEQSHKRHRHQESGLPPPSSRHASQASAVALMRGKIDVLLEHVTRENNCLYFLPVPSLLPELPAELTVMIPLTFVEPGGGDADKEGEEGEEEAIVWETAHSISSSSSVHVSQEQKASFFGSLMGGRKSKSVAGSTVSGQDNFIQAPVLSRSASENAAALRVAETRRSLQRQQAHYAQQRDAQLQALRPLYTLNKFDHPGPAVAATTPQSAPPVGSLHTATATATATDTSTAVAAAVGDLSPLSPLSGLDCTLSVACLSSGPSSTSLADSDRSSSSCETDCESREGNSGKSSGGGVEACGAAVYCDGIGGGSEVGSSGELAVACVDVGEDVEEGPAGGSAGVASAGSED